MSVLFAKSLLRENISFALLSKTNVVFDTRNGITPLLTRADDNFFGCIAADKIVGEAAAWLYTLTKPDAIATLIITTKAKQILMTAGIPYFYDSEVPMTLGRDGTSRCPIEESVIDAVSSGDALEKIKTKIKTFSAK